MFEAAEVGHTLDKTSFEAKEEKLRAELIAMQYRLRDSDFPVVVVVAGDDHPGCDDVIQRLNEWLDARFVRTNAYGPASDDEAQRPAFWRYWRDLPPRGRIGIFSQAWSAAVLAGGMAGGDEAAFLRAVEHVERFEQAMADDGAIIIKFWLHLPKQVLHARLKEAEAHPDREWRVHPDDWLIYESLEKNLQVVETFLRRTSTGAAPWHVIESTDPHYRDVAVAELLLEAIQRRLQREDAASQRSGETPQGESTPEPTTFEKLDPHTVLDNVNLDQSLGKKEYHQQLAELQTRLAAASRAAYQQRKSAILLFEGWDAAGKGGTIRRLVRPMKPQLYHIVPIAAPSQDELAHHYLWRFWRHMPRAGHLVIFDRSWYGRVLVERVEGFATQDQWRRAYHEINDFEEQLVENGYYVGKFWLHISRGEQRKRFKARESTPYKRFKITDEDYRNRKKWNEYEAAVAEMVARTSSSRIPWNLIAANDKRFARCEVLRIVCEGLESLL